MRPMHPAAVALLLGAALAPAGLARDEPAAVPSIRVVVEPASPPVELLATALLDPRGAARARSAPEWPARADGGGSMLITLRLEGERRLVAESRLGASRARVEVGGNAAGGESRVRADVDLPLAAADRLVAEGLGRLLERDFAASDVIVAGLEARRLEGDLAGAEAAARALARRLENDARPRRILAECAAARGLDDRAIELWREAAALDPSAPLLHARLGDALARSQRPLEASEAYRRALELLAGTGDALADETRAALTALEGPRRVEERRREAWARARADVFRHEKALRLRPDGRDLAARRRRQLEERLERDPADEEAWLALIDVDADGGPSPRTSRDARRAVESVPGSRRLRVRLGRALLLDGRYAEAVTALADGEGLDADPEALVLLGDARMALVGAAAQPSRWREHAPQRPYPPLRSYLLPRRPAEGTPGAASWDAAGESYRRALELAPEDHRAAARRAEWLMLSGRIEEARQLASRIDAPSYPDLHRVRACLRLLAGNEAAAERERMEFLERTAVAPEHFTSTARALAANGMAERALRLLERALAEPENAGNAALRVERGRVLAHLGRREEAAGELRFALAAGEREWEELRRLWEVPPIGPRAARPPETARRMPPASATDGAGPETGDAPRLPGAPFSVGRFVELRTELAAIVLELAAAGARGGDGAGGAGPVTATDGEGAVARLRHLEALAELREVEWFLEREETRLRSGRLGPTPGAAAEREWTRPESRRDEPVDFGNTRHRMLWAEARLVAARCRRLAGDLERAVKLFAWSARALAVRDGAVLPEREWKERLTPPERALAAAALRDLAAVRESQGGPDAPAAAMAIREWAAELDRPPAEPE